MVNQVENGVQCRILPSPPRNFFKRSAVSPACVVTRLILLFFKLVNVSNMKRVLELGGELSARVLGRAIR